MYKIIKSGDTHIVVESMEEGDVEHKIPITLMEGTEEDLLDLIREVYHDTRLQYKYNQKKQAQEDFTNYADSYEQDEDYVPDLTELFQ